MPRPLLESSGPTLRKSQRPCGRLQNCLVRRLLAGGSSPVQGWWWRGSQKSNKTSKPPEIAKNGEKTDGFAHVFAYKSPKTPFFAIKYLTRYTRETFFEEYINFKNFRNLSHCGVIPVRSFRSHIRTQPHGLGKTVYLQEGCPNCKQRGKLCAIPLKKVKLKFKNQEAINSYKTIR